MPGLNNVDELIVGFLHGTLSAGEEAVLKNWINEASANRELFEKLANKQWLSDELQTLYTYDQEKGWNKIADSISSEKRPLKIFHWSRIAAAIVLLLGAGAYFYFNNTQEKQVAQTGTTEQPKNDIAPGGDKAVLTLADGSTIILDSANNGTLTQQGNTKVIKLDDGQIAYNGETAGTQQKAIQYNTLTTPRGGQYQIVLSDGSKVWLNAESSLRFPTSFSGNERNVELKGEGYFEITSMSSKSRQAKIPFVVSVPPPSGEGAGMEVHVLGTHFNINAYYDEEVQKTTLLEGVVQVTNGGTGTLLNPGQQAVTNRNGNLTKVVAADLDEAIAWKNGRFIFQGNSIQSVMRQLARWYNAEVTYEEGITNEEFVGVINRSRYENISQILEMMERTRTVSFDINGNKIRVKPYRK